MAPLASPYTFNQDVKCCLVIQCLHQVHLGRLLGNTSVNPHVGLLFVDFENQDHRLVNGVATLHFDDLLLAEHPGAQLIVRVRAERIFPNCPRYIHKMKLVATSIHVPTRQHQPPEPDWKRDAAICTCCLQWFYNYGTLWLSSFRSTAWFT
ncbi:MAG TPA: pyridoxamine 5'-phosphate oxidase family protein [Anaerolineaceae bacterium]|nr:pyridoxamine 5'-phosphate oxidase family protein [Anaerolineaceae bacterium]